MTKKRLALVAVVVLVALATVGIAYGLWFEVLQVKGTINTSELDVGIIDWGVTEECFYVTHNGAPVGVGKTCTGEPLFELKQEMTRCRVRPVAAGTYEENPEATDAAPDNGKDGLLVTINEAYPGYECRVDFTVKNLAEVPVHIAPPLWTHGSQIDPSLVNIVAGCFNEGMIAPPLGGGVDGHGTPRTDNDGVIGRSNNNPSFPMTDEECNDMEKAFDALDASGLGKQATTFDVTFTRYSDVWPGCDFRVGLAAYEKVLGSGRLEDWPGIDDPSTINDDSFSTQWLHDFAEAWMPPKYNEGTGEPEVYSTRLRILRPTDAEGLCATQVDWYVGPTLTGIGNRQIPNHTEWYGHRKFGAQHLDVTDNLCDPRWQLHKGEQVNCAILISFDNYTCVNENGEVVLALDANDECTVLQENDSYEFWYEIPAWQWNEDDEASNRGWYLPDNNDDN